ncbi:MAG: dihydrofolate reductase family protein [Chloroflexi bacterium]|nr:dihydrofolate reductase family protein [Chloroflexota bacterium]
MSGSRPYTTLFLLVSADGKTSTGSTDEMDVDRDFPNIPGVGQGLKQYYDLQIETDEFSLNTGKTLAKTGVNQKQDCTEQLPVSFVVVDSAPHLTGQGTSHLAHRGRQLLVVTTNPAHPALALRATLGNLHMLHYDKIDFTHLFDRLKQDFGVTRMTIQSGGSLNATLVRAGLVDRILLVVAPALIGGKDTPTPMDGESLHTTAVLSNIKPLDLVQATALQDSYVLLEYKVRN